jgi:hypothetical protein
MICLVGSEVIFISSIQQLQPSNLILLGGAGICEEKIQSTRALARVSISSFSCSGQERELSKGDKVGLVSLNLDKLYIY